MRTTGTALDDVKDVLVRSLGIETSAETLNASTPLLDSLPELDSLAVIQLVYGLEDQFGLTINDDEISADIFETLGSLARFIDGKLLTKRPAPSGSTAD